MARRVQVSRSQGHLVLGGSQGIGFAYARWLALRGQRVTLVARRPTNLARARRALLALGSPSVTVRSGDVLDRTFRARLGTSAGARPFRTILVSGPSPRPGPILEQHEQHARVACESVLLYPLWAIRTSLAGGLARGGTLIIVSSSADKEPLGITPFALSALFRRALSELVAAYNGAFASAGLTIALWRPGIVLTPLAKRHAVRKLRTRDESTLRAWLEDTYRRRVLLADAFVTLEARKLKP